MTNGKYDNFGGAGLDYRFYSLTFSHNGFYGKPGTFQEDFGGSYFEAGYGSTLNRGDRDILDYAVSVIHSDSKLLGGESDTNFVVSLSRAFDFQATG
jgi:hypothetical protein